MSTYTPTFGTNQINPIYTQAVRDYRLNYTLTPFITQEQIGGRGDPTYFTRVKTSPEFSAQAGLGTELYQQSSYAMRSITTDVYTMEFILPLLDKVLVNINTVAVELDNISRSVVKKENEVIANALINAPYSTTGDTINEVLTASGTTLTYSDIILARNQLRKNGFGMGVGSMALLVGQGSVNDILNDEKLVNNNYVTALKTAPSLNNTAGQFALGGIQSVGLIFEIPEITEDAYLIDIPFALKTAWRIQPTMVQLPSNGLYDAYRVVMDFGVKALNYEAVVKIDIIHA